MMKKYLAILVALLVPVAAHAQGTAKSKTVLEAEILSCFPDNTTGQITPAVMRGCVQDFLSSWQQFASVNAQVGTSYTVANADYGGVITFNNSGSIAVTLAAATSAAGFYPFNFWVSDLGVGAVTITPQSGTINGAASFTLTTNEYAWIVADGTNWQVIPITTSAVTILGGNANSLGYYATTGTTISPLTACNSGVYVTSSGGVPSCSTAMPSMLTIPSPVFSGQMVMPDTGTWDNTGINGSQIGGVTPATGTFTTLNFTTMSAASLGGSPSTITGLTVNNSPNASNDYFLYYSASAGAIEKCTIGSCTSASAAGVTSLNGLTGGLNVTNGGGLSAVSAGGSSVSLIAPVEAPQGRLTLQSHTPVMTTSQSNMSTIYYDCFKGGYVPVYNGSIDVLLKVGSCEISDTMPTSSTGVTTSGGVFDEWAINVSGTLTLCHATNGSGGGWASDTGGSNTARGTGYTKIDNTTRTYLTNANSIADCYNGSTNKGSISANEATYLGTFFTVSNGETSFTYGATGAPPSAGCFCIWNAYNQVNASAQIGDSRANWTYGSATVREADGANNSGAYRVQFVTGLQINTWQSAYNDAATAGAAGFPYFGVCFSVTNAFSGGTGTGTNISGNFASGNGIFLSSSLGANFVSACEAVNSSNSQTFSGANNGHQVSMLSYTGTF